MCIHDWAHWQVWVSMKGSDILTNVCINMRVLYIWHPTYIWQDLAISQNLLFQLTANESKMVFLAHKIINLFLGHGLFCILEPSLNHDLYERMSISFLLLDSGRCILFKRMKQGSGSDFMLAQLSAFCPLLFSSAESNIHCYFESLWLVPFHK